MRPLERMTTTMDIINIQHHCRSVRTGTHTSVSSSLTSCVHYSHSALLRALKYHAGLRVPYIVERQPYLPPPPLVHSMDHFVPCRPSHPPRGVPLVLGDAHEATLVQILGTRAHVGCEHKPAGEPSPPPTLKKVGWCREGFPYPGGCIRRSYRCVMAGSDSA